MEKISSNLTFLTKRILPVLMLVPLAAMAGLAVTGRGHLTWYLAASVFVAVLFYEWRIYFAGVADEVYDRGGSLLIRNRGAELSLPLANITGLDVVRPASPPRVTLHLNGKSRGRQEKFGDRISFLPKTRLSINPLAKNAVVEDLIARVNRARA